MAEIRFDRVWGHNAALLTLTAIEIVPGVDNVIFISILVAKLPEEQRARARLLGVSAAMIMRIALLSSPWVRISRPPSEATTGVDADWRARSKRLCLTLPHEPPCTQPKSGEGAAMTVRVGLAFMVALASLGNAQAGSALGGFAEGVLEQLAQEAAKPVVAKAAKEFFPNYDPTDGVLPAMTHLQEDVDSLEKSVKDIHDLIVDQTYKQALADAIELQDKIEAELDTFRQLVQDVQTLTKDNVNPTKNRLNGYVTTLRGKLNHPDAGVIPALMNANHVPPVTALHDYWSEIDDLRRSFTNSLLAVLTLTEGYQAMQQKAYDKCLKDRSITEQAAVSKPVPDEYEYVGTRDTACRANTKGAGGPSDPAAKRASNVYFDMHEGVSKLRACQQKCTELGSRCTGIEYNRNNRGGRCELWKAPINYIQPSSYGYACYEKKKKTAPPALAGTDNECHTEYQRISEKTRQDVAKKVLQAVTGMYAHGVPLVEGRPVAAPSAGSADPAPAKFVHVRGKPWALGAPVPGSGYFATFDGAPDIRKLDSMSRGWGAANRDGKSLERFLQDNHVPTAFVDQSTWKCETYEVGDETSGNINSFSYEKLTVNAYRIWDNTLKKLDTPKTRVTVTDQKETRQECTARLNQFKAQAGREYSTSNGALTGGVEIGGIRYFGRFFTYNLTGNDLKRVCDTFGARSKQCLYATPTRLDAGGRAALRSAAAVDDYLMSR